MADQSDNLSTQHQGKGDARKPSDTLDRPADDVTEARDWQPGEDEGKAKPSGAAAREQVPPREG